MLRFFSCLIFILPFSACTTSVPEVPVAEQWTATINNYSLQAIFPLREDVRVGDIKLTVDPSTVSRGNLPFRDIGQIDFNGRMKTYYENRPSYPKDDQSLLSRDGSTPWPQPRADTSIFEANTEDVNRLRIAALPGVKVATMAQGTLAGQIPLQGFTLGGAVSAKGNRLLDISLTGIEELKAPDDYSVFESFKTFCETNSKSLSNDSLDQSLALMTSASVVLSKPQLSILNYVLYARAIDYTFKSDEGYGADLAATVGAIAQLGALSTVLGDKGNVPPSEDQEGDSSKMAKELADLVASIRAKITGSTAPGLSFSTVYVDARGVTLRDVFEVPLAFAAQVVSFDYKPDLNRTICGTAASTTAPGRIYSPLIGN